VTIRRPELQKCPLPPKILDGWLLDGWQNPEEDVKKCEIIKNSARRSEKFSSSAARVKRERLNCLASLYQHTKRVPKYHSQSHQTIC
jgi:hypothetical protein